MKRIKEEAIKIIELSYLQLVVIFLILVLLKEWNVLVIPVNYQLFIPVLPLLAVPILIRFKPAVEKHLPPLSLVVVVAFLLALSLRLLPFAHSAVPLGYDPGFYKYATELYAAALPQIPEAGLAIWLKEMHPQAPFILSNAIHILTGTDAFQFITFLFSFLGALLVFAVFVVTRELFGQRAALVATVLYAVSYTQYSTFTMFYYKNVLGLMFLLLAIYSLEKKKFGLMALMFAALGIFHRPEFLIFALVLIPYFILHRRQGIVLAVLGTAVLIAPFYLLRWEANWGVLLSGVIQTTVTNIQTGEGLGSGTFFNLNTYATVALAYLPFSLVGLTYLAIRRKWNSMMFYFLINSIIVLFRLFFYNRLIIPLDIAVVILAGVGINYTLLHNGELWKRVVGIAALILLLVTSGLQTVNTANNIRPLVNEKQLEAIEQIKEYAEEDAYVLGTSYDAPWLLGWSERKVIAPGLFEWNVHTKDEWLSFFETKDPLTAKEFLDVYDGPIYIYYSKNWGNYLGLEKFQGGYFQKVYDDGAVVYKYSGGG